MQSPFKISACSHPFCVLGICYIYKPYKLYHRYIKFLCILCIKLTYCKMNCTNDHLKYYHHENLQT